MSEVNNTPEELVEDITVEVEEAQEIPSPIDPTLTQPGQAADAFAVGQAIAAVLTKLILNGKTAVANAITLYAADILMSDAQGAQTLAQAIEAAGNKKAEDIMYDPENMVSVKTALDAIDTALAKDMTEAEIDEIWDEVFNEEDDD